MSETNKSDISKEEDAVDDQEMDNLSLTEKAAFEKIMAEISVAESDETEKPIDSKSSDDKILATESDSQPTAPSNQSNDNDSGGGEKASTQSSPDEDDLSDDQQAALDQIMAEIDGDHTKGGDSEPKADPEPQDQSKGEPVDEKALPDDQQAALDQIMTEIKGDGVKDDLPSDNPIDDAPERPSDSTEDGALPDDQQAAMDKIMSEINGDDTKVDPAPDNVTDDTPEPSSKPDDENALSDDQQAALDDIMAEIEGGTTPDTDSTAPNEAEQNPELEEKQSPPAEQQPQPGEDESDGLTLEEFDDQLSSLLTPSGENSDADENSAPESPEKSSAAPPEQSLADINSALKDIVKKSAPVETQTQDQKSEVVKEDAVAQNPAESSPDILKEIDADNNPKGDKNNSNKHSLTARWKRAIKVSVIISCCTLAVAASYWGYTHLYGAHPVDQNKVAPSAATTAALEIKHEIATETTPTVAPAPPDTSTDMTSSESRPKIGFFDGLTADISSARQQLQSKKAEIIELKHYYQNGILKEQSKLRAGKETRTVTYKDAIQNRQTELGLRSIQRRMIYNTKLDTPLRHLETALEQLLYMERRARLFELLNDSISGLSLADLKNEGEALIHRVLKQSEALSIDAVKVTVPSLKAIWQELDRSATAISKAQQQAGQLSVQDRQIGKEICSGSYDRKYLLSALTVETAACLTKWPGKDLYLNEIGGLSPKAAKQLAQWQGEWLSLNGVKSLSADSAKLLSQWPGKRLSLNGVTRLSPEATTYLSQWQGDQLEMVGLTSIGRWENYVTRLFLSEQLRRKLNMQ